MRKLGAALLLTVGMMLASTPPADAGTSTTFTYAELNCNWQDYTDGQKVDGVDLTWAKSGRYIRAARMADLFKNKVNASIYALTECDSDMMSDLADQMGSSWKYVGGSNSSHNRTGWLYDSSKWRHGDLIVTKLPGDPDGGFTGRRLLEIDFYRKVSGTDPKIRLAMTHLSSGNPQARDLQMKKVLDKLDGKEVHLSGDLNASTPPSGRPCEESGPRAQLACAGWVTYGASVPSWHDYGQRSPALPLDVMAVSPRAQATGKITVANHHWVDTAPNFVTDHVVLVESVTFR